MFRRLEDTDILVIGSHFCDPSSGHIVRDRNHWMLKAVE
jgi:hypothetical protein